MTDYKTSQDVLIQQEIENLLAQKQRIDDKIKLEAKAISELEETINQHKRKIKKYKAEALPFTTQISTLQFATCVHLANKENTLSIEDIDKRDYTTNIIDNFQRHSRYKYLIIEDAFIRLDAKNKQKYRIDLILAKIPFKINLASTPKDNPTMTDIKQGKLTSVRVGDEKAEEGIKRFANIMQQILLTPICEYQNGKRFPFKQPCLFLAQDTECHENGGWKCRKYAVIGIEVHTFPVRRPYRSCAD